MTKEQNVTKLKLKSGIFEILYSNKTTAAWGEVTILKWGLHFTEGVYVVNSV